MRRNERELTGEDAIRAILDRCDVCHLALTDGDRPYLVPMSFGYTYENGTLRFYFHCAKEGKKLDILRKNPQVWFELDCKREFVMGEAACSATMHYQSVMGGGTVRILDDPGEKEQALRILMGQYTDEEKLTFEPQALEHMLALELTAEDVTAKASV